MRRGIDDAVVPALLRQPQQGQLAMPVPAADAHKGLPDWFNRQHPRQLADEVLDLGGAGFDQSDAQVLPLDHVPLRPQSLQIGAAASVWRSILRRHGHAHRNRSQKQERP